MIEICLEPYFGSREKAKKKECSHLNLNVEIIKDFNIFVVFNLIFFLLKINPI